jgi:hypothetical protein
VLNLNVNLSSSLKLFHSYRQADRLCNLIGASYICKHPKMLTSG